MRSRRPMLLAFAASFATLTGILLAPAAGRFRGSFPVPHTAAWLALYRGGGSDFAVTSKAIAVRVR